MNINYVTGITGNSQMNAETLKLFELTGKSAVVTGGARGLGAAIARALAGAGAKVVAGDVQKPSQQLGEVDCQPLDVTKEEEVRALVESVAKRHGRLDIMVANAGIPGGARAEEETEKGWDEVMNVNAKGVFLCCREAARSMRSTGGGSIITLASALSFVGHPTAVAYCASKGAIAQMTRVMAIEWAKYGIRVNAIAPGFFNTPLNAGLMASEELMKPIHAKIPLGRGAEPEEIGGLAIYLASRASSFMTGSIVSLDGGEVAAGGYTDAILPGIYEGL